MDRFAIIKDSQKMMVTCQIEVKKLAVVENETDAVCP